METEKGESKGTELVGRVKCSGSYVQVGDSDPIECVGDIGPIGGIAPPLGMFDLARGSELSVCSGLVENRAQGVSSNIMKEVELCSRGGSFQEEAMKQWRQWRRWRRWRRWSC